MIRLIGDIIEYNGVPVARMLKEGDKPGEAPKSVQEDFIRVIDQPRRTMR